MLCRKKVKIAIRKTFSVTNANILSLKDGLCRINHTALNTFIHTHTLTCTYTFLSAVHSVLVFKSVPCQIAFPFYSGTCCWQTDMSQKESGTDKHRIPGLLSLCEGKRKSTPITGCRFLRWKTPGELPVPLSKPRQFSSQKLKMTRCASGIFSEGKGEGGALTWPTLRILSMCLCMTWKPCQGNSSAWISVTPLDAAGPR